MSNGQRGQQLPQNIQSLVSIIANKNFLDDEVMKKAEGIGKELSDITTTKMRQYFDDIKGLRRRIESGLTEQQVKVQLRLIQSRLAYDVGRASKNDKPKWEKFKQFIDTCINKIISSSNIIESTNEFITFFESIYGYFYYEAHQLERR